MITKNCAHCGAEFEAKRSNAKYCKQSCRTSASYKRNGYVYRQGHYEKPGEKKEQGLSKAVPVLPVQQGMNGFEVGRAKDDLTFAGAAESFIGASVSNFVSHQLTKGEYDERLADLQQTLNQIHHELKILNRSNQQPSQANKVVGIPTQNLPKSGMPMMKWPIDPMT